MKIIRRSKATVQASYSGSEEWWNNDPSTTTEDAENYLASCHLIKKDDAVRKYLASRDLELPPGHEFRAGVYKFGPQNRECWSFVFPLRNAAGELQAVQMLLLDQDGRPITQNRDGKEQKVRITIGPSKGASCRVMPMGDSKRLFLTEGVEDALAVWAYHKKNVPVWAACGARALADFEYPNGVDELTIFADHDLNGSRSALAAAHRIRAAQGPRPTVGLYWSPKRGQDPYDVVKEDGKFVPVWQDRARRYPLRQWGVPHAAVLIDIAKQHPDTWAELVDPLTRQHPQPKKKDMLTALRAELAEQNFAKRDGQPLLELHPLRQEMFTRLEDLLPEKHIVFIQGEGAGARVVTVETTTEERRRELARQEIFVITGQPMIVPVNAHMLADKIERAVFVYKETPRGPEQANFPHPMAVGWLESGRANCLSTLRGLAPYPVIRTDGHVSTSLGYDRQSAFWLTYDVGEILVPDAPTQNQAKEAARVFLAEDEGLFATYPFSEEHHRVGALAFLLQLLDRHNHRLSPAWVFDAPTPRTGKMHLMRTCALVSLGGPPVIYAMSDNREERHKRVTHLLLDGSPLVCADNINGAFDSSDVATYLGEGRCAIRSYGMTGLSPVAVNSNTLAFTGNNMMMTNDMQTRCFKIRLDAKMPDPDKRHFPFDPHERARKERRKYLTAALTILRWASLQKPKVESLGGLGVFTEFDARIRHPLMALTGIDVAQCLEDMREGDPDITLRGRWFSVLAEMFPDEKMFSAADLIAVFQEWEMANVEGDGEKLAKFPFPVKEAAVVGRRLGEHADKFGGDFQMVRKEKSDGNPTRYRMVRVTNQEP